MPKPTSPAQLIATLLSLIFLTELAMMFVLDDWLQPFLSLTPWQVAVIDAGVLTALTSLFVWRLFMQPLSNALAAEVVLAHAVTDAAAEGIIVIDAHGAIESFNSSAEAMFGYRADEVIGQNIKMLMPAAQAALHDKHIENYVRTGKARVIGRPREEVALRKDGSEFPISLNVRQIVAGDTRRFAGIFRDITEQKKADARIERLAHYDSLTGIPKRVLFYDRLAQSVILSRRDGRRAALLYLDLDRFKPINDTLGHDAGDDLLKAVAERVCGAVRDSDTVARLGGDEFAVILPEIRERNDAALVAEKIVAAFSAPFHLDGGYPDVSLGVSIGIAIYPDNAAASDALVLAADGAMYAAKKHGNSYRFSASNVADVKVLEGAA